MQQATLYLILGALALGLAITLLVAWRTAHSEYAKGYDLGHADAARHHQKHINALHEDLDLLRSSLRLADAEHYAKAEALGRAADELVAAYARRANPFTAEDAVELMKVSGQLKVTAVMAERVGAHEHRAWALKAADNAKSLAERIRQAIEAAAEPAPPLADTARLDWLEETASGSAVSDTFYLYFTVGQTFQGPASFRAAIDHAMAQEQLEAAA
ncbi:hypothetical protein A9C11_23750 [Pseudomonas citronellolis]|uniref:Uncharacterized protein n=1 Tax=Pseudomonas citronellolis TaxID=53408 RepID=A0A1A9KH28_9PSED|nr:hypothetical protein [Pseudomonas citronellolis]ANI16799.1 hypothetical protein A9C11_23750 [Pseudomonas citronellolis]